MYLQYLQIIEVEFSTLTHMNNTKQLQWSWLHNTHTLSIVLLCLQAQDSSLGPIQQYVFHSIILFYLNTCTNHSLFIIDHWSFHHHPNVEITTLFISIRIGKQRNPHLPFITIFYTKESIIQFSRHPACKHKSRGTNIPINTWTYVYKFARNFH